MDWKFSFSPWQKAVLRSLDNKQFTTVAAGRRSGKTHLIQSLIHLKALHSKINIAVVYPTLKTGRSILFNNLVEDYYNHKEFFSKDRGIYKPQMYFKYHNGSTVKFYSLERPDDLRGLQFGLVILDEAQELTEAENVIESIIEPTLTPTTNTEVGKCLIMGTSKGRNDFYQLIQKGKNPSQTNWQSFIIPTTPKNCPHIPSEYLIEKKLSMNPLAFEREYLCSFESYEGLIYSEFSRDMHVVKQVPLNLKIEKTIIGIDIGYSPHPMGIVVVQKTTQGVYYVVDEIKKQKITATDDSLIKFLKHFIDRYKATSIYLSPEENHIRKILQDNLKNIVVKAGDNKVADGIGYIRNLIHFNNSDIVKLVLPKLYVCQNCGDTISEFENYTYKDNTETPLKLNDDLVDALRYAVFTDSKTIKTKTSSSFSYY